MVIAMDVKTLREIQRKERMSPYLQELGKDFYSELEGYLKGVRSNYLEESKKGEISKLSIALSELENIKAIISDIYETREKKIVSSALYYVRSETEMGRENLTKEEADMLKKIIEVLREKRASVLEKVVAEKGFTIYRGAKEKAGATPVVEAKVPKEVAEVKSDREEKVEEEEQIKAVQSKTTVRILKDLPSIVGVDGHVYGSFKQEDVVTIPEPNARVLINQGVAEQIDVEAGR
ncbi:MAG: hypothetical protein V3T58_04875 [Candidatus Hydrothermarchaeales archaeon]